jgi:Eco57I restriction-modification methylase
VARNFAVARQRDDAFDGMADLYIYFYEQGLRLLRPGGRMSYVVTNKWLRAGYAEALRDLFATKGQVEFVADFGHAKHFFPDADVFPSVVVVASRRRARPHLSKRRFASSRVMRSRRKDCRRQSRQRPIRWPAPISPRKVGHWNRRTRWRFSKRSEGTASL